MLIDWFTVGAQTLNFLVLVWLLKRFLYRPILAAIDARESRIANTLADAASQQKAAKQEREEFSAKNVGFEQQRSELLQQAVAAANKEQQKLLDAARNAANVLTVKREQQVQAELQNLQHELSRLVQTQVIAIARKTLMDLASTELESAIIRRLIVQLQQLQGEDKSAFTHAIQAAQNCLFIRSAFELTGDDRAALQQAVNECFARDITLNFTVIDALLGGIEITAQGQVLTWTIDNYLGALEKNIADSFIAKPPAPLLKKSGSVHQPESINIADDGARSGIEENDNNVSVGELKNVIDADLKDKELQPELQLDNKLQDIAAQEKHVESTLLVDNKTEQVNP